MQQTRPFTDQKRQVIAEITDTLVRVLGRKPKSVVVFINEVRTGDIGLSGRPVTVMRQDKP